MPFPWLTQAQLEGRLGAAAVQRAFDDDGDGAADPDPVDELLKDACSYVGGALGPQYTVDTIAAMSTPPREVTRLSLDVAVCYAIQRHPEIFRRDWEPALQAVERECARIRKGNADLGVAATTVEPAAQNGGDLYIEGLGSSDEDQPTTYTRDGFGDF